MPTELPDGREYELRDGTVTLVRPIRPTDKDRLQAGLHQLSELSIYRRFMAIVTELSPAQLAYLTEIDYRDHMAFVALKGNLPGARGIGVARYIRLVEDPTVAEMAITVLDSYQGRGLGTLLLGLLGSYAAKHGVGTFRAHVLQDNNPMLRILRDLGAIVKDEGGGELRIDVPVPSDPRQLPETQTGRVLKVLATRSREL